MAKTPSRLYIVTNGDGSERLVDAQTPSQAIRHVVGEKYKARPATAREAADLAGKGIKPESAAKEQAADAQQPA